MKRIMFTLLIIFVSFHINAQERQTYHLKLGQILESYDIKTGKPTGNKQLIKETYNFTLETIIQNPQTSANDRLIWLLEFSDQDEYDGVLGKDLNSKFFKDSNNNHIYFLVPAKIWDEYVEEVFKTRGITFGIVNIPIKLRFPNSNPEYRKRLLDLDGNVNLGLSVAPYWKKSNDQIIFLATGITVTQIKVDEINTLNYVSKTENRGGFGIFIGAIYQKDVYQIGLMVGADYATGDVSEYWVYQGKPWLGVGIGIGIFQPNKRPESGQKSN